MLQKEVKDHKWNVYAQEICILSRSLMGCKKDDYISWLKVVKGYSFEK
jgi:hypothetical protein